MRKVLPQLRHYINNFQRAHVNVVQISPQETRALCLWSEAWWPRADLRVYTEILMAGSRGDLLTASELLVQKQRRDTERLIKSWELPGDYVFHLSFTFVFKTLWICYVTLSRLLVFTAIFQLRICNTWAKIYPPFLNYYLIIILFWFLMVKCSPLI